MYAWLETSDGESNKGVGGGRVEVDSSHRWLVAEALGVEFPAWVVCLSARLAWSFGMPESRRSIAQGIFNESHRPMLRAHTHIQRRRNSAVCCSRARHRELTEQSDCSSRARTLTLCPNRRLGLRKVQQHAATPKPFCLPPSYRRVAPSRTLPVYLATGW